MTKEEMLKRLQESNAVNVKKAEDTLQNIETKEVKDAKVAQGISGLNSELPTQKAIEKEVNKDEGPVIPADKDGVSKDGGNDDRMEPGKVEAERKKEDNGMKDVINVSSRKVEESNEISNELLEQLEEATLREAEYKAKIDKIIALCEQALDDQKEALIKASKIYKDKKELQMAIWSLRIAQSQYCEDILLLTGTRFKTALDIVTEDVLIETGIKYKRAILGSPIELS